MRSHLLRSSLLIVGIFAATNRVTPCAAQLAADPPTARPTAVSYGPETVSQFRIGAKVTAGGGAVENIRVMVAVPLACPEQQVELVNEDVSSNVEGVEYRDTDAGVRQMLIYIPSLPARQEATAYATFEVRTATVVAPQQTATLAAPKKPDHTLKRYLGPSPFIDVNHRKIRAAVREATARLADPPTGATGVWERVEALYDYALEHVKYKFGAEDMSSVQALAGGEGDCQSIGAVFVAMCRTEEIPARMVWVDGHQYAEFYLEDETGAGCWYPVETAGSRAFGEMPLARVILQKGDNFRVPERPRERLRYASDYTLFLSAPTRQPKVVYVREMVQ